MTYGAVATLEFGQSEFAARASLHAASAPRELGADPPWDCERQDPGVGYQIRGGIPVCGRQFTTAAPFADILGWSTKTAVILADARQFAEAIHAEFRLRWRTTSHHRSTGTPPA